MTRITMEVPPLLSHGRGSLLYDVEGREWIDLASGFGAVFLGHAQASTVAALRAQADRLWACARLPVEDEPVVDDLLGAVLPAGMRPTGLLSTGMEAAEFAMRIAATHTGRREFVGFASSMHGKSAMTAALCWHNAPLRPGHLHTLPFVDTVDEAQVLERLRALLATSRIAALFIEPIQGSNGAHAASLDFHRQAAVLCREHGSLLIVDEILTGLYRTGPAFFSTMLPLPPDLLLFAKNMGNGFPVSAVARSDHIQVLPQAMPGSTFARNPLALAAVRSTLETMASLPMAAMVLALEAVLHEHFDRLAPQGLRLRGRGALWCLELGDDFDLQAAFAGASAAGVLASGSGRSIRLLPAATIPEPLLHEACERLTRACLAARRLA